MRCICGMSMGRFAQSLGGASKACIFRIGAPRTPEAPLCSVCRIVRFRCWGKLACDRPSFLLRPCRLMHASIDSKTHPTAELVRASPIETSSASHFCRGRSYRRSPGLGSQSCDKHVPVVWAWSFLKSRGRPHLYTAPVLDLYRKPVPRHGYMMSECVGSPPRDGDDILATDRLFLWAVSRTRSDHRLLRTLPTHCDCVCARVPKHMNVYTDHMQATQHVFYV